MIRAWITKPLTLRLKKGNVLKRLARWVLYGFVRLLFSTYRLRVTYVGVQSEHDIKGVVYFWHQQIIAGMYFFAKTKTFGSCVVSPSNDGRMVGFVCQKLGFNVLYGSHQKETIALVRNALGVLKTSGKLCLVGDGSRGPAFQLQKGIEFLATKAQVPLVYVECRSQWAITFKKSWDQFQIPLPFSKIFVTVHVR